MQRRRFLFSLVLAPMVRAAAAEGETLRGALKASGDGTPALQTPDGKLVLLTGDDDSVGVMKDKRLTGADFEVVGKMAGDRFAVNPIHMRAMFVHKGGKRLMVTYWCDICSIRTYTPGICWCCREETALDLREPDTVDSK